MIEYKNGTGYPFTEMDNPFQFVISPEDLGAGVRKLLKSFLN